MEKINRMLLTAVWLSLFAHLVFFLCSPYILFPMVGDLKSDMNFIFKLGEVDKKVERVSKGHDEKVIALTMPGKLMKIDSMELKDMFINENIKEYVDESGKKNEIPDIIEDDKFFEPDKSVGDQMLKAESYRAKKDAELQKKTLLNKSEKSEVMLKDNEGGLPVSGVEHTIKRSGFKWSNVATGVNEKFKSASSSTEGALPGKSGAGGEAGRIGDISSFIETKLYVYDDKIRNEKYFKLVIRAKEGVAIESMPKEVIFLIDSSKSMTEEKLVYIKKALIDVLRDMKAVDKFNIVAFKGELSRFKQKSVAVSQETVNEAANFIKGLKATGQTDVYNALLEIVKSPQDIVPSYVMIITDARPTTGLTDSKSIIREITRKNSMKRPIFSFGTAQRVNKYLLDFIAYQNRAWSTFSGHINDTEKEFNKLNMAVRDPILLNLRYRIINLNSDEVYPKYLPDFYRESEFKLYGRYNDEDLFSIQLVGDIPSKSILRKYDSKELIFQESLKEAIPGDDNIAREWAFRKIYYLISQDTLSEKSAKGASTDIEWLSHKYGIGTQYDIDRQD